MSFWNDFEKGGIIGLIFMFVMILIVPVLAIIGLLFA